MRYFKNLTERAKEYIFNIFTREIEKYKLALNIDEENLKTLIKKDIKNIINSIMLTSKINQKISESLKQILEDSQEITDDNYNENLETYLTDLQLLKKEIHQEKIDKKYLNYRKLMILSRIIATISTTIQLIYKLSYNLLLIILTLTKMILIILFIAVTYIALLTSTIVSYLIINPLKKIFFKTKYDHTENSNLIHKMAKELNKDYNNLLIILGNQTAEELLDPYDNKL